MRQVLPERLQQPILHADWRFSLAVKPPLTIAEIGAARLLVLRHSVMPIEAYLLAQEPLTQDMGACY